MDQRLIVRIQLLLPLFALSSWAGLHSDTASNVLDPIREIYEAFVIYTFFTLLTNILGGERDIIISTSGRAPKPLITPLNYIWPGKKVDISDPYVFLTIKRSILQYTWIKPILCLATVILNALGKYRANSISLKTGYMWLAIIYNISITISLYALALFWYLLLEDLKPYRPLPKFLCIKVIIFFSYWQGFILSILVYFGLIPSSNDSNFANTIQNSLMCIEMLPFAIGHWVAFSYKDYATSSMIGFARLPVYYAIRDAFGTVDLVVDFMSTFYGSSYGYRQFDSVEAILDHPESASRRARIMAGLRYKNGGRSKYWLPQKSSNSSMKTDETRVSLLPDDRRTYGGLSETTARTMSSRQDDEVHLQQSNDANQPLNLPNQDLEGDELIYTQAKRLRYGDYNYPVITVRESIDYTTVIDRQMASGVQTTLAEEYESFAGGPGDSDDDFFQ